MEALVPFPRTHCFNFVARVGGEAEAAALAAEVQQRVAALCEAEVEVEGASTTPRLGGKYVSLAVPVRVRAAAQIERVLQAFEGDARFVMRY